MDSADNSRLVAIEKSLNRIEINLDKVINIYHEHDKLINVLENKIIQNEAQLIALITENKVLSERVRVLETWVDRSETQAKTVVNMANLAKYLIGGGAGAFILHIIKELKII